LELAGRDIYISEGCFNCHSQMIRTIVPDVLRYGDYSRLGESIYDYPFQWGSKRTGPDLARVGGKYPNIWHYHHMLDPRAVSPGSNMPNYPWLFTQDTDVAALPAKLAAQRTLGVPYPEYKGDELTTLVNAQATAIAADLKAAGVSVEPGREIVALIAYLQKLGKHEVIAPRLPVAP
jgi:cytochrome c oxidase cbb3-type subunit I/II